MENDRHLGEYIRGAHSRYNCRCDVRVLAGRGAAFGHRLRDGQRRTLGEHFIQMHTVFRRFVPHFIEPHRDIRHRALSSTRSPRAAAPALHRKSHQTQMGVWSLAECRRANRISAKEATQSLLSCLTCQTFLLIAS